MPRFARRSIALLLMGAAALPRQAWAVPNFNFDISAGDLLLALLVLVLLTVGAPMLIGLVVHRVMLRTHPGPRAEAGPPLALPCVVWLCTAFICGVILPGTVTDFTTGVALFLLLTVGTTTGAAILLVQGSRED